MQFYKKVLLTLSGAGIISSCAPLSQITHSAQGRVVEKNAYGVCLDSDGDGLADAYMDINDTKAKNNQCYFQDYIAVGDTLKYRTTEDKPVILSADWYRNAVLDSINGRSAEDLKRIYDINSIRIAIGQEKAR
jgi:hypothetical protein